jgi:hypothetical protein
LKVIPKRGGFQKELEPYGGSPVKLGLFEVGDEVKNVLDLVMFRGGDAEYTRRCGWEVRLVAQQ